MGMPTIETARMRARAKAPSLFTRTGKPRFNGAILWQGISPVDGAPIALIATGFASGSANSKTGKMIQTWIIRTDIRPDLAVLSGEDSSVCGNCPHRRNPITGRRSCYVTVFRAPLQVYKAYHRGSYPDLSSQLDIAQEYLRQGGNKLRIGSYGDPAMIPFTVWETLLEGAANWTGYSHQEGESFFDTRLLAFVMVSKDGNFDPEGPRSFRVIESVSDVAKGEVLCPASEEAGKKTTCAACGLCKGGSSKAKSVAIVAHGIAKKAFRSLVVLN